jgi:hypothetical protein
MDGLRISVHMWRREKSLSPAGYQSQFEITRDVGKNFMARACRVLHE